MTLNSFFLHEIVVVRAQAGNNSTTLIVFAPVYYATSTGPYSENAPADVP
jgi:hypothetical protein